MIVDKLYWACIGVLVCLQTVSYCIFTAVTMSSTAADASVFDAVAYVAPDAIFELTQLYNSDSDVQKVNLGQGTYKDEQGNPWILPSVRAAKEKIKDANHEYLPILGLPAFRTLGTTLVYGEKSQAVAEHRVRTIWGFYVCIIKQVTSRLPHARPYPAQALYTWPGPSCTRHYLEAHLYT